MATTVQLQDVKVGNNRMKKLKKVLMKRDGLTSEEADDAIAEAQTMLHEALEDGNMEKAYYVCEEMFGLEPDYLEDLF